MKNAEGRVLVRTTSASVKKHTGKTWDEWITILDKKGASTWPYKELTAFVRSKKASAYWSHIVAQGFETAKGKRVEGRNQKGFYSVTVTSTLPMTAKALYQFWTSAEGAGVWLRPMSPVNFRVKENFEAEGGIFGEVRSLRVAERLRLRWQETEWDRPSTAQFYFAPRRDGKSMIAVMHEGLQNARLREQMRTFWRSRFEEVKVHLQDGEPKKSLIRSGKPKPPRRKPRG